MPSYLRPGVYFNESLLPAQAVTGANLSAGAFLAPNPRGPVVPMLISSWAEYLKNFGGFWSATDWSAPDYLPYAVYEFFANGGRQAWCCRVAGSGAATATITLNDRATTPLPTLKINAANPGTWAGGTGTIAGRDTIYIDITDSGSDHFNIIVKLGGTTDQYVVERWTDLTLVAGDARYAPSLINAPAPSGSSYISIDTSVISTTAAPDNRPALQAGTALAGGANGSANPDPSGSVNLFDSVDAPLNLNLPGYSGTGMGSVVSYAEGRGDVFVVCDPPKGAPPDSSTGSPPGVISAATSIGASSYGAIYYPWIQVADPSSSAPGSMILLPPGGAVIGQFAATDTTRGVFKTPAGINNRIAGAVGVERKLIGTDLDTLNPAGVNAIRQIPGAGIVIMGGRTLKPTGTDKYISARRSLIYIRSSLIAATRFAVFEPNDTNLWTTIRSIIQRFLLDFWASGGLRGDSADAAFFVKCDDELNTPTSIAGGEVHIQIGVALQYPAEFVVFNIAQRETGATVTVTT